MIYVTILKQLQSDTDDITHHYTTFIPIHIGEEKNTAATIRTYITSLSLSYTTYLPKRVKMYKKNQYIHTCAKLVISAAAITLPVQSCIAGRLSSRRNNGLTGKYLHLPKA